MPRIIEPPAGFLPLVCLVRLERKRLTFDDFMASATASETKRLTADAKEQAQSSELETASESEASVLSPLFLSRSLCFTVCGTNGRCPNRPRSYSSLRSTTPFITPPPPLPLPISPLCMSKDWHLIVLMWLSEGVSPPRSPFPSLRNPSPFLFPNNPSPLFLQLPKHMRFSLQRNSQRSHQRNSRFPQSARRR